MSTSKRDADPYAPTGDLDDGRIILGTKLDKNRRTSFRFDFDDGQARTFYHFTQEQALEDARLWGLGHGRIGVVDDA